MNKSEHLKNILNEIKYMKYTNFIYEITIKYTKFSIYSKRNH